MTIKLHDLRPAKGAKRAKVRVGRGEGSKGKTAGLVVGAKAPIVLTSRSDSAETKLLSIASAVAMAAFGKK